MSRHCLCAKPFCSARPVRAPTAPQRFAQGKAPRKNALAMDPARERPALCASLSPPPSPLKLFSTFFKNPLARPDKM